MPLSVEKMLEIVNTHTKLKKVMTAKGLKEAKTTCPHCTVGVIYGRMSGPKNHLWMKCNSCSVLMIE